MISGRSAPSGGIGALQPVSAGLTNSVERRKTMSQRGPPGGHNWFNLVAACLRRNGYRSNQPADVAFETIARRIGRKLHPRRQFAQTDKWPSSDIHPAFERITNNRDMWKGQCERQTDTLRELRMQLLADDGQMQKLQAKLAQAAGLRSQARTDRANGRRHALAGHAVGRGDRRLDQTAHAASRARPCGRPPALP